MTRLGLRDVRRQRHHRAKNTDDVGDHHEEHAVEHDEDETERAREFWVQVPDEGGANDAREDVGEEKELER